MRMVKKLLRWIGTAAVLVAVGIISLTFVDFSSFRPQTERFLSSVTGHAIKVEGPIRFLIAPPLAVGVRVSKLDVSQKGSRLTEPLLVAEQAEFHVKGSALFNRRIELQRIVLSGAELSMERPSGNTPQWDTQAWSTPVVEQGFMVRRIPETVLVSKSVLHLAGAGRDVVVRLPRLLLKPAVDDLEFHLESDWNGQPFGIAGKVFAWEDLLGAKPVKIDVLARLGATHFKVDGTAGDPAYTDGLTAKVDGAGPDLNDLAQLLSLPALPKDSKLSVNSDLRVTNDRIVLSNLAATVGRGGLSGELSGQIAADQTAHIEGTLTSKRLDVDPFVPDVEVAFDQKFSLPEIKWPSAQLKSVQLDLAITAESALLRDAEFQSLSARALLIGGALSLDPVSMTYGEGNLTARLEAVGQDQAELDSEIVLSRIDAGQLSKALGLADTVSAKVDFGMQLKAQGDSIKTILASMDGQTNLLVDAGTVKADLRSLVGDELFSALNADGANVQNTEISCLVSRIDFASGVGVSRGLLFETAHTISTARGDIDLNNETVDMVLAPRPKDPTLLGRSDDIRITGDLWKPDMKAVVGRKARGVAGALGGIAFGKEGATLLPLLDEHQSRNPCVRSMAGLPPLDSVQEAGEAPAVAETAKLAQ